MIPVVIRCCLVAISLLPTTGTAESANASMSWSQDGEWLAYTVTEDPARDELAPGWLFDTRPQHDATRRGSHVSDPRVMTRPSCQIWATRRNNGASVLIEEANWPLTPPSWSPRGKLIAFGRFVPQSIEPNQAVQRGRLEVVIQNGMNRKRVLWTSPDFEFDDESTGRLSQFAVAWSPDGRYLALSHPGREPSILLISADSGRVLATLDNGTNPAWSPDGSQCAFIRRANGSSSLCLVERRGQSFATPRQFIETGSVRTTPGWSSDSQFIFAVAEKSTNRAHELVLDRVSSKTGDSARVLNMVAEAGLRVGALTGVVIDFDRDGERCYFSPDIEGRENELGLGIIRDPHIPKRFPPIDAGLRIAALAISPDGRYLAIRYGPGPSGSVSPPSLYDLSLEQSSLIVPDEGARRQWLNTLVGASRNLLISALPPVTADGQSGVRPTLLPLPGDVPPAEVIKLRLTRMARLALPLCAPISPDYERPAMEGSVSGAIEGRIFFAYLLDDFPTAAAELDVLNSRLTTPDDRLSLLSLRAQVLWSQGDQARAQAIIDYLVAVGGAYTRRVEETPYGLTMTVEGDARQVWARYLSARAADGAASPSHSRLDMPSDLIEIPLQQLFAAPEFLQIDKPIGNAPFAPVFPAADAFGEFQGKGGADDLEVVKPGRERAPLNRAGGRSFP